MRFNLDSFQMEWTYHVVLYLVTHTLNPWLKMHDQRDGKLNETKQVYRHSHQRACISAACAENVFFFCQRRVRGSSSGRVQNERAWVWESLTVAILTADHGWPARWWRGWHVTPTWWVQGTLQGWDWTAWQDIRVVWFCDEANSSLECAMTKYTIFFITPVSIG